MLPLTASACKDESSTERPERPEPPIMRTERAIEGMLPPRGFPPHSPNESGADEGKGRPPKVTPPERKMIFILVPPEKNDGEEEISSEKLPAEQVISYN